MKTILSFLFLSLLFFGTSFAFHGAQTPTTSYYIGDVSECRYILQYTCEHGHQKFADSKGCGCRAGSSINTVNQYNTSGNIPAQNYYTGQNQNNTSGKYYIPQHVSSSQNRYCGNKTRQVCGAPKNTCTGNNCPILHPRTYKNICQLEAVNAKFLTQGECQTYNRINYNSYTSQNYRTNYSATDEDYLLYLVNEFIYDLEKKNYSGRKIISTIDRVITRLEDLGDENNRYQTAARDAIWELKRYRDAYEDEDAYEKIENIFERY